MPNRYSPQHATDWTPQTIELATKLWREGESAASIARRIGGGATRSSVIGKLHRLGVTKEVRHQPGNTDGGLQQKIEARVRHEKRQAGATGGRVIVPLSEAIRPKAPVHDGSTAILSLLSHQCKWPLGDPSSAGFRFCCASKEPTRSYCADHLREATQVQHGDRRLFRLERLG